MKPRCRPYCKQELPEIRLGVRLPALKARIFDLVLRGGRDGIQTEDLFAIAYDDNVPADKGIRQDRARKTLHNHISQINEMIEDSGYRVINSGGAYRLENLNSL